jgi:hypothetical protein
VSLVPAPPAWRKWTLLGLGLALVVGGGWMGLSYVISDVQDNVKVQLASEKEIQDAFNKKLRDEGKLQIPIIVKNESMVSFSVDSVTCDATFLGTKWECRSDTPEQMGKDWKVPLDVSGKVDPNPASSSSVDVTVNVHVWGIPVHLSRVNLVPSASVIQAVLSPEAPPPPKPKAGGKEKEKEKEEDSGGAFPGSIKKNTDLNKIKNAAENQAKKLANQVPNAPQHN